MARNNLKDWTAQKERTSGFWLKIIRRLALLLPRWAVGLLLHPITLFYLLISKQQKAASRHYLNQVLDRPVRFSDVYKHFLWFATTILDRVYFLTGRIDGFQVEYDNLEEWRASMAENPAQLYLGAHFGSLDAIRALSLDQYGIKIKIVLKVDQNQALVNLLNELNPGLAENVIPYNGMKTIFDIHETLESGNSVAMLKDRAVGEEATVTVNFFNDRIAVPVSGFKLAKRFNIPINVFFSRFEGGNKYHVHSEQLEFDQQTSLQEMAQIFMNRVEEQCRIAPYNWFNFYHYWLDTDESDAG
ncbi:hypothetical protein QCB45_08255 [Thiomicrorhabdus sp. ZW0627]|uniref:LpxL/LpxP family acyltransferase n=1 Tax=Thiomicrorhabdus sp. ZW0627 TaxID=3039774 RepID=UPI0024362DAC|nr:hypothetical protein [Thiomicrorhabdus sp. ZW0627]MDG6774322.1 hypothetical protein [Thiomicrorhabdus sp. ZW0627]